MRHSARSIAAAAVFGLAAGGMGGLAAQDTAPVRSDLVAEVEAAETAFAATMAERDFESFLTYVAEEAVFFEGERPLRGAEAVADGWRGFFEGPDAPFAWRPDQVEVLASGDLALSSGPVLNPAGDVVGRFNSIWRRDGDGRWRVVFDKGCP